MSFDSGLKYLLDDNTTYVVTKAANNILRRRIQLNMDIPSL
jgi:hypothetical protein